MDGFLWFWLGSVIGIAVGAAGAALYVVWRTHQQMVKAELTSILTLLEPFVDQRVCGNCQGRYAPWTSAIEGFCCRSCQREAEQRQEISDLEKWYGGPAA